MKAFKLKKILATILCICFVTASFLPLFFIATHEHHDCVGKDCVVCSQLEHAKNTLKQLSTGGMNYSIPLLIFTTLFLCIINCFSNKEAVSLVTLKIRMDH